MDRLTSRIMLIIVLRCCDKSTSNPIYFHGSILPCKLKKWKCTFFLNLSTFEYVMNQMKTSAILILAHFFASFMMQNISMLLLSASDLIEIVEVEDSEDKEEKDEKEKEKSLFVSSSLIIMESTVASLPTENVQFSENLMFSYIQDSDHLPPEHI
jgi:hypothetical protein